MDLETFCIRVPVNLRFRDIRLCWPIPGGCRKQAGDFPTNMSAPQVLPLTEV